eukprot:GHVN01020082.1.p1 GENE.GHVN01020082.1~~GHVN01020082.1.p1  ORF type:complete len:226 (+),score=24.62 GHVN01020082.1:145-822(+)
MDVGSPLRKMSPSAAVGAPLSLQKIRSDLIRQEETIIFAIIERTQYRCNDAIYRAGHFDVELDGLCLMSYFLRETERLHAKLRRYVSDEEHAFFADSLPCPVLPIKGQPDILKPNRINLNEKIFQFYVKKVVPRICPEGDDGEYGSTANNDIMALQALSRRIHYGLFVAEAKFRSEQIKYRSLIEAGDVAGIMEALTNRTVEEKLLERVSRDVKLAGTDTRFRFD